MTKSGVGFGVPVLRDKTWVAREKDGRVRKEDFLRYGNRWMDR